MNRFVINKSSKVLFLGLAVVLAAGFTTTWVRADIIDLNNYNSAIQIDPTSQAGMQLWTVDGHNYEAKQWFWLRVGSENRERSLDALTYNGKVLSDWDGDGVKDSALLKYSDPQNPGLKVWVTLTLQGGSPGSGTSDIAEQIRLENTSNSAMSLHLFQYCNFILSDGDDAVSFDSNNRVTQLGGVSKVAENYSSGEGVVTGFPIHQAGLVTDVPSTLYSLNDDAITTLNGANSAGPGNANWAFQWNISVPANSTRLISKDKILNIVPEPSGFLLLSLAGTGLILGSWLKKRTK
jgi:hypothetical protein